MPVWNLGGSRRWGITICLTGLLLLPRDTFAYSVLTHEAIIDAVWDGSIVPMLRARFGASPEEIRKARAFAYGGCLLPDIGYYPLSSRMFGDLAHYVRTGDFVTALIESATDVNEYAFALGMMAHYTADNLGHPLAINRAVPLTYPKLRMRYGDEITYEENPAAHVKTEFAFDVVEVASGKYSPEAYHDFIGFEVSKPVLERAFAATYNLEISDVFNSLDLAIGTFRWAVSTAIPLMTKVAWEQKHDEIAAATPDVSQEKFLFTLSRAKYEQEWGAAYSRPGFGARLLAVVLRIVPKIGPFRALAFRVPPPEAERLFLDSLTKTVDQYRLWLLDAERGRLRLENRNCDTGQPVKAGDYRLVDQTYDRLLRKLSDGRFAHTSAPLRQNLLAFYADVLVPATKKDQKRWRRIANELAELKRVDSQAQLTTSNGR